MQPEQVPSSLCPLLGADIHSREPGRHPGWEGGKSSSKFKVKPARHAGQCQPPRLGSGVCVCRDDRAVAYLKGRLDRTLTGIQSRESTPISPGEILRF